MMEEKVLKAVLGQFALPRDGLHGLPHWARVYENGLRLAETVKVDRKILELFALFHDARRISDGVDRDHGRRGAEFAYFCRGLVYDLPDADFSRLYAACSGHTELGTDPGDDTVRVCWDAERLDLARLGIKPRPSCMCTRAARDPDVIRWACDRARGGVVPPLVQTQWRQPQVMHGTMI